MPARNPKEVIQQFVSALSAGNIDGVVSLYEADGAFIPPGAAPSEAVRGRDAIRQTVQQFLALNPTMTVDPSKAIEVGDIALVTGSWTPQGQTADGDMKMSGAFANIVRTPG
jgi:uncharacterized protein (TIGR02246 family)